MNDSFRYFQSGLFFASLVGQSLKNLCFNFILIEISRCFVTLKGLHAPFAFISFGHQGDSDQWTLPTTTFDIAKPLPPQLKQRGSKF